MEFTKVLQLRQSTRAFKPDQITKEQLQSILDAAYTAPTCMGKFENVHLIVVQDAAILKQLNAAFAAAVGNKDAMPTYGAPTVIYVCNKTSDEEIIYGANASCIMENMLLSATNEGLASVYLFGISQAVLGNKEVEALLNVPEGFRTISAIAVGTAAGPINSREIDRKKITTAYL